MTKYLKTKDNKNKINKKKNPKQNKTKILKYSKMSTQANRDGHILVL